MTWDEDRDEPTEVEVDHVKRRAPASLICMVDGNEVVLPYSLILEGGDVGPEAEPGETGTIVVPLWLAKDRGLV